MENGIKYELSFEDLTELKCGLSLYSVLQDSSRRPFNNTSRDFGQEAIGQGKAVQELIKKHIKNYLVQNNIKID